MSASCGSVTQWLYDRLDSIKLRLLLLDFCFLYYRHHHVDGTFPTSLRHNNRSGDHTFQLFGEEHLHQEPEEEYDHDALDHALTTEEHHRLPQRLPRVLLIVVRHDAKSVLKVRPP